MMWCFMQTPRQLSGDEPAELNGIFMIIPKYSISHGMVGYSNKTGEKSEELLFKIFHLLFWHNISQGGGCLIFLHSPPWVLFPLNANTALLKAKATPLWITPRLLQQKPLQTQHISLGLRREWKREEEGGGGKKGRVKRQRGWVKRGGAGAAERRIETDRWALIVKR